MRKKMNNVDKVTSNLFAMAGDEEKKTPYDWDDMPEFNQTGYEAYHTLNVRFRNEEDLVEFSKLIQQAVNSKTKAIWHPALDTKRNSLLRWIDEDADYPDGECKVN